MSYGRGIILDCILFYYIVAFDHNIVLDYRTSIRSQSRLCHQRYGTVGVGREIVDVGFSISLRDEMNEMGRDSGTLQGIEDRVHWIVG